MPQTSDVGAVSLALLEQMKTTLQTIERDHKHLAAAVDVINEKVNQIQDVARETHPDRSKSLMPMSSYTSDKITTSNPKPDLDLATFGEQLVAPNRAVHPPLSNRPGGSSRIILTTYPGQSGIDPLPMRWGHKDPKLRGPVIVSRSQSTIRRRNGMILDFLGYTDN